MTCHSETIQGSHCSIQEDAQTIIPEIEIWDSKVRLYAVIQTRTMEVLPFTELKNLPVRHVVSPSRQMFPIILGHGNRVLSDFPSKKPFAKSNNPDNPSQSRRICNYSFWRSTLPDVKSGKTCLGFRHLPNLTCCFYMTHNRLSTRRGFSTAS